MATKKKNAAESVNFLEALREVCKERDVAPETMFEAIERALEVAYKKNFDAAQNVEVNMDRQNGAYHVYALKNIVEEVKNKITEISLSDAQEIDPNYNLGDVVKIEVTPMNFGRIAAQAAKQFVIQRVRELERGMLYDEFSGKENDIVTGTVVRIENGDIKIDIGKAEATLLTTEQMRDDNYQLGDHIKAYIVEVKKGSKGPQIYVSRTHPGFLKCLFKLEVPEIQDGIIDVKTIVREPGIRSKVSVISHDENIEPVGTCIGNKGLRVQAIVDELGGNEKIDLIKWDSDPGVYVANALSPSKVKAVWVNTADKIARVVVPDKQLSLAIGKEGQNARLAAKLTGWKIDIKTVAQAKDLEVPEGMVAVDLKLPEEKPKQFKRKKKKWKNWKK